MTLKRRDLIKAGAAAGGLGAIAPATLLGSAEAAPKPLNIVFLGGTGFIGPHMVERALERGHTVTLFNRGNKSEVFPGLEQLTGDRDGQLDALAGRRWDAVVDTSGYVPRHVRDSAKLLAEAGTPHYLFISTVAVYDRFEGEMDEGSALATMDDPTVEEVNGETYGPLKVLCEKAVLDVYPENHTILRPTYIIGPGDHTDRFIYYLDRPRQGGRYPVPAPPDLPVRHVDVRDLANFTIHCLEQRVAGIYNTVNEPGAGSFGDVTQQALALADTDADPVWIGGEVLEKHGLDWRFPMARNVHAEGPPPSMSPAAAMAKGFRNRPLAQSVRDTWDWWLAQPEERRANKRDPLPAELQAQYLAAWDAENA